VQVIIFVDISLKPYSIRNKYIRQIKNHGKLKKQIKKLLKAIKL